MTVAALPGELPAAKPHRPAVEEMITDPSADLVAIGREDRARYWGHARQILPTSDMQRLHVTESLGHVSVFDADSLQHVSRFRAHSKRCLDIALLDTDTRLITISTDGSARLWDLTGETPMQLDEFVAFDADPQTSGHDAVSLRAVAGWSCAKLKVPRTPSIHMMTDSVTDIEMRCLWAGTSTMANPGLLPN